MDDARYIQERIDDQIAWLGAKSGWNQRRFKRLRLTEMALAGLIPVLVSLPMPETEGKVLIAAVGATVSLIAGAVTLWRHQELWVQYRATSEALKREKFRYLSRVPPYDTAERFARLVDRVETLLGAENAAWTEIAGTPASTTPPDKAPDTRTE